MIVFIATITVANALVQTLLHYRHYVADIIDNNVILVIIVLMVHEGVCLDECLWIVDYHFL